MLIYVLLEDTFITLLIPFLSFFSFLPKIICSFIEILHISCFQTVDFRHTASDTVQVPRQSRGGSCHISISCHFYGLPVLPFILCCHVPWLSHYSCGNTPGIDTFLSLSLQCQMFIVLFRGTLEGEKKRYAQNALENGRVGVLAFKTDFLQCRFIILSSINVRKYAVGSDYQKALKQVWARANRRG